MVETWVFWFVNIVWALILSPFNVGLGFFIAFGYVWKPGLPAKHLKTGNTTRILFETLKTTGTEGEYEAVELYGPYGFFKRRYIIEGGFLPDYNAKGEVTGIRWPKKMALEQADRAILAEAEVLSKLESQITEYKTRYEVELAKNKEEVHSDVRELTKSLKEMYPYGSKTTNTNTRR